MFVIHSQFIKDLSFENKNVLNRLEKPLDKDSKIDLNYQIEANKIDIYNGKTLYESGISLIINAQSPNSEMFLILEIKYMSIVEFSKEIDIRLIDQYLRTDIPHLLFPYLREIVSHVTINGAFPITLQSINFYHLYNEYLVNKHKQQNTDNLQNQSDLSSIEVTDREPSLKNTKKKKDKKIDHDSKLEKNDIDDNKVFH